MKLRSGRVCALAFLSSSILAAELKITNQRHERLACNGMYSRKAWGGDTDPFILTKFIKSTPKDIPDPRISLAVYEWRDQDSIGLVIDDDPDQVRE